jgi:hypothetical protein
MILDSSGKLARGAVLGALLLLSAPGAWASSRIDLNGPWQFRLDPDQRGEQLGWTSQLAPDTETVGVPHTWNIGKHDDYEGTAWYFKTFRLPDELLGKHLELHFGATFYKSRVWLNGAPLGGHEGGHTAYVLDATAHLRQVNYLAAEINNQPTTQTIPGWAIKLGASQNLWYDWWHYGGLVRDVWLTVNEPQLIRRQQIRVKLEGTTASVTDRVFLENHSAKPLRVRLSLTARDPEGKEAASVAESFTLVPGSQEKSLTLRIDGVRRWHFDHPVVYRLEASLYRFGRRDVLESLDSIADNFGARTIEIRDRHLYLNGEPVRLTGMTRHEDSPWEGLAETRGTMKHDYDDMKQLQVTLTRPVHYPQNPYILDYCDRNGILLIPEIPMWQFSERQMSDPKVLALAEQMMREMIEQDFNHPSIFAWSVCNESATSTPGGRAYFRVMYDLVKSLDPDRYVTYADDRIAFVKPAENAASLADFIMWNEYFGTWHGPESLLPQAMERLRLGYPDKMVIVSELGAADMFAPNTQAGDRLRARIFRQQLPLLGQQDWIAGIIMWCYQDYKSHRNLWPGETAGYVEMGVVDQNRQRRPSYKVWRELNSPAKISLQWQYDSARRPVGFRAGIERRAPDEIPSYTLRDYRVVWEVRDNDSTRVAGGEKTLGEIGPPQSLEASWPASPSKSLRLTLRLFRPTGFLAAKKLLDWWEPRSGGLGIEEMKRLGIPLPEL